MIINNGNHYLKRKYYKMLDFSDEKLGDKRFDRLEASYIVFKNHPIIGAGMGKVGVERYKEYVKMNDKTSNELCWYAEKTRVNVCKDNFPLFVSVSP